MESEKDPDALIIMSTHGCSGVGRWVMGSVTDRVLHAVKTPLITIRTEDNDAVLDGSPLAEKILPHAVALAKAMEEKLRLVRVTSDENVDAYERHAMERLAERIRGQGVYSVEGVVLHGDPATAIVDLTHEYPDALVAMTTHGRSAMNRWLMSSVANRVVRHAAGPVMVLRG